MTAIDDTTWSVPRTEVMRAARRFLAEGRRGVLATIVAVEGSAYRRPGAKMLIPEGGEGIGHITAGCLEDEVQEIAAEVLAAGEPRLETYDLMQDDEDVWGLGVGCNGVIDILLEPLDDSYAPAIEAYDAGGRVGVLTVLGGDGADALGVPQGTRAYYHPDAAAGDAEPDTVSGDADFPDEVADALRDAASRLAERGQADTLTVETDAGEVRVFVDGVRAPPSLVVCGSGHDVGPMVELGSRNDFRVTVVGFRGAVDLEERFPEAAHTVTTSPGRLREDLSFDDNTYAVVATHNFVDDRLAVDELLRTDVPYVGVMGPRDRFEEMLAEFRGEDRSFAPGELDRVYTPIGLNLGGGEPYQIATSIVSEVLAVHNDRDPGHLRDREGPIHERVEPTQ
ncbi:MAG: XdhC family protein [Haloferacaceae archaeon]